MSRLPGRDRIKRFGDVGVSREEEVCFRRNLGEATHRVQEKQREDDGELRRVHFEIDEEVQWCYTVKR
jgi:hypothetical protein